MRSIGSSAACKTLTAAGGTVMSVSIGPEGAPSSKRGGWRLVLAILVVVISVIALPIVYALSIFGLDFVKFMHGPVLWHFGLNCTTNALVLITSIMLKGRLDRKLAAVLTTVLVFHGFLAFLILTTREFYSIQLMMTSVIVSVLLGICLMYLRHRSNAPRIAVLGPFDGQVGELKAPYDRVTDPAADLRPYDVLLTTSVVDLSAGWAKTLSSAMITGKRVRHLVEYIEEQQGVVSIEHFELDHISPTALASYHVVKRVMDILLILLLMPLILSLVVIGSISVLIFMGRPILFIQDRVGRGGNVFRMYKLRSMISNSDISGTPTVNGDARITKLGKYLRRYRIDELPQILNVLKGDMSIIGPRPEWTTLVESYSRALPAYAYRHLVRPGITGWAQVRGGYASDLDETRRKVGFDLFYIKNLSFSLDIQILIRTVWTVVAGGGAR